jgi:hypothetical protein
MSGAIPSINKSFFYEKDTLNNIFGILFVGLFVTIFEILLFYFIIINNLRTNIYNGIDTLSDSLKDMQILLNINDIIDKILIKIFDNESILNSLNLKVIKDNIKNEIKDNIKNEIKDNIKNEIIDKIKNEIKNEIKEMKDNDKNEIKNEIKKEIKDEIIEMKDDGKNYLRNEIIENFKQFEQIEEVNTRKYNSVYNEPVGKKISEIIIKVLNDNNIKVDEKTSEYIEILITTDFNNKIYNILNTLKYDEKHTIDINNNNTKVISFLIVFILIILIILVSKIIKIETKQVVESKVYITSIIIIICIVLFQINIFYFSKNYNYLGNRGNEEIIVYLLNRK